MVAYGKRSLKRVVVKRDLTGLPPPPPPSQHLSPVPIYTPGWRETIWSKASFLKKEEDDRDPARTPNFQRATPHCTTAPLHFALYVRAQIPKMSSVLSFFRDSSSGSILLTIQQDYFENFLQLWSVRPSVVSENGSKLGVKIQIQSLGNHFDRQKVLFASMKT